ncbi:MAG TPA: energy transducer TonB, partial [Terricaulis sp.]|nr:energy transducer TonB [Terricaulis sp.]
PMPDAVDPPPAPPTPSVITDPTWVQRPDGRDFARHYPPRALDRGQEGRVTLDCIVNADGRISCTVTSEEPSGWGFGEAAIRISRSFRMAPATRDGAPTSGGRVRVPIRFNVQ